MPARERPPPWTLSEGLRTALSILVRRASAAIGAWGILLILLGANAPPVVEPPPRPHLEELLDPEGPAPKAPDLLRSRWAIRGVVLVGAFVGWVLTRRLVDRLGFTGLELRLLAMGVAAASIGVATLIALPFLPDRGGRSACIAGAMGCVMAAIIVVIGTADD